MMWMFVVLPLLLPLISLIVICPNDGSVAAFTAVTTTTVISVAFVPPLPLQQHQHQQHRRATTTLQCYIKCGGIKPHDNQNDSIIHTNMKYRHSQQRTKLNLHLQQQQQHQRETTTACTDSNVNLNSRRRRQTIVIFPMALFSMISSPGRQVARAADTVLTTTVSVAAAEETTAPVTTAETPLLPQQIRDAFTKVRYELNDSNGGVTILQQHVQNEDYASIMEFTKTYDLTLRKGILGKAKKLVLQQIAQVEADNNDTDEVLKQKKKQQELRSKVMSDEMTRIGNAITFDLIGMNRNSRTAQESISSVNKYFMELQADIQSFVMLETEVLPIKIK